MHEKFLIKHSFFLFGVKETAREWWIEGEVREKVNICLTSSSVASKYVHIHEWLPVILIFEHLYKYDFRHNVLTLKKLLWKPKVSSAQ